MPPTKPPHSATMVIVALRWNGELLATRAVKASETVVLGDAEGALASLPEEVLGRESLVVADTEGGPHVLVPQGKVASIAGGAGGVRLVAGPAHAALSPGEEASLLFGAFELTVGVESAEPRPSRRRASAGAWVHTAVVAAVHAALLAAGSRAALASSIVDETAPDLDQLRGYLAAAEERSAVADAVKSTPGGQMDTSRTTGRNGNGKDAGGERRSGDTGKAGSADSRAKNRHFGAPRAPERGTSSSAESEIEAARDFGVAGILKSMNASPPWRSEGASPWGAEDPLSAAGGLLGRITGESEGSAGLALSGTGEGGGGRGDGIGLGSIGTIGHADGLAGVGTGGSGTLLTGLGFGGTRGRLGGRHRTRAPTFRWGHGDWVSGRLPPESVQRVIRSSFGRFRGCYQEGLLRNPTLAGRVTTSFVIGRDGAVSNVGDAGGDLPDRAVSACVRRAFYALSFPQPEGGIVSVVYPIVFSSQ